MQKPKHTVASLQEVLQNLDKFDNKNVPFDIVIKAFSNHKLEAITDTQPDRDLVSALKSDLASCMTNVSNGGGIESARVNEVGNKIEQHVIDAINNSNSNLKAERPATASGKAKTTGYPDILIWDSHKRPTYLEAKTYSLKNIDTSFRSFYLSPSDDFKVTQNARHLLLAFEMNPPRGNNGYIPVRFKLVDLAGLVCSLKFEIQSNNKRLYAEGILL